MSDGEAVRGGGGVTAGLAVPAVWVPQGRRDLADAVRSGGGRLEAEPTRAEALVWADKDVEGLVAIMHPGLRWVQLPDAGVERWLGAGIERTGCEVTTARGSYGPQVAEHALALLLAGVRRVGECARLERWPDARPEVSSLAGADVAVVGAGGIGSALTGMLAALGARPHCVSRRGTEVPGAVASHRADDLRAVLDLLLPQMDHVVLALPSTSETRRVVDRDRLRSMRAHTWLVNVGRGDLVETGALVDALAAGRIGGAALDVTDPEPLPPDHPLWSCERALITPHVANPPALKARSLAARVEENTRRLARGLPLTGRLGGAGY